VKNMRYPEGRVEFDTACPMDLNPISGYRTRSLTIQVLP
jgi:hypothetical protein